MPSIRDVAKKANVSIGTVSRALRGIGYLSDDITSRVSEAADELGYIASYNAQQLKSYSPEKTVGIIISETTNEYFYRVIAMLKAKLSIQNIRLIVTYSMSESEEEERNIKYLISNRVSAIIFIPNSSKNKKTLQLAIKNNIKVIQLFVKAYENLNTVINDDEQGTALAAKYLMEVGCSSILLLDAPYKNLDTKSIVPNRRKSFLATIKDNIRHLCVSFDPYCDTDNNLQELTNIIYDFRPDGIIAGIGPTGQLIARLLFEKKYTAKFVAFDDNDWYDCYGITAVKQDTNKVVDSIYELVMSDSATPQFYRVSEKLIIRNT